MTSIEWMSLNFVNYSLWNCNIIESFAFDKSSQQGPSSEPTQLSSIYGNDGTLQGLRRWSGSLANRIWLNENTNFRKCGNICGNMLAYSWSKNRGSFYWRKQDSWSSYIDCCYSRSERMSIGDLSHFANFTSSTPHISQSTKVGYPRYDASFCAMQLW